MVYYTFSDAITKAGTVNKFKVVQRERVPQPFMASESQTEPPGYNVRLISSTPLATPTKDMLQQVHHLTSQPDHAEATLQKTGGSGSNQQVRKEATLQKTRGSGSNQQVRNEATLQKTGGSGSNQQVRKEVEADQNEPKAQARMQQMPHDTHPGYFPGTSSSQGMYAYRPGYESVNSYTAGGYTADMIPQRLTSTQNQSSGALYPSSTIQTPHGTQYQPIFPRTAAGQQYINELVSAGLSYPSQMSSLPSSRDLQYSRGTNHPEHPPHYFSSSIGCGPYCEFRYHPGRDLTFPNHHLHRGENQHEGNQNSERENAHLQDLEEIPTRDENVPHTKTCKSSTDRKVQFEAVEKVSEGVSTGTDIGSIASTGTQTEELMGDSRKVHDKEDLMENFKNVQDRDNPLGSSGKSEEKYDGVDEVDDNLRSPKGKKKIPNEPPHYQSPRTKTNQMRTLQYLIRELRSVPGVTKDREVGRIIGEIEDTFNILVPGLTSLDWQMELDLAMHPLRNETSQLRRSGALWLAN